MASSSPQNAVVVRTTTVAIPTTSSGNHGHHHNHNHAHNHSHNNPLLDLFAFVKDAFSSVLPLNMGMNSRPMIEDNNNTGNAGDRSCLDILKRLLGGSGGGATELRIAALPVRELKVDETLEYDQNCCSICLDGYEHNNRVRILGCGHCYHVQCVDKWLMKRNACPMCSRVVC